jgi:hypothetical protein
MTLRIIPIDVKMALFKNMGLKMGKRKVITMEKQFIASISEN